MDSGPNPTLQKHMTKTTNNTNRDTQLGRNWLKSILFSNIISNYYYPVTKSTFSQLNDYRNTFLHLDTAPPANYWNLQNYWPPFPILGQESKRYCHFTEWECHGLVVKVSVQSQVQLL